MMYTLVDIACLQAVVCGVSVAMVEDLGRVAERSTEQHHARKATEQQWFQQPFFVKLLNITFMCCCTAVCFVIS